jgi:nicotinamide riboside kinase
MKIAVLGAECTGKTSLIAALDSHWTAQGLSVHGVAEVLRQWCDQQGRTPRMDEQWGIAQAQAQQVLLAPECDYLIADTNPLMTAVYSDVLFGDRSLYLFALNHQRNYQHTLVTGMDLSWQPDGIQRDGPAMRERIDARLREVLQQEGLAFSMVYGQGAQRLASALAILEPNQSVASSPPRSWRWLCDKCSDADCEHRLFRDLQESPSA